jgi:hypothetical protein
MNLTKNFTFEEMTKSETALRFSMGNHPGDTELQNLIILCEKSCNRYATTTTGV